MVDSEGSESRSGSNGSTKAIDSAKVDVSHEEVSGLDGVSEDIIARFLGVSEDAQQSEKADKQMTFKEAITTYPKAAAWSAAL